jgi:proteasome accessory factor C
MSNAQQQLARLLALVPYLQNRSEVLLDEAAADFGVTPRQLRRDLDVLWYCGYPGLGMGDLIEIDMEAVDGEGVIRLSNADYLMRPLRLGSSEAAALMVALRTLREGAKADELPAIDRALAKIESAAGDAAALSGAVEVQPIPTREAEQSVLQSLRDAVGAGLQIRITHVSAARDVSTTRIVDPLEVVEWQGHSYLYAWCHQAEDRRTFRLDRIVEVVALADPVGDHPDADPVDLSEGIFRSSDTLPLAHLRLQPSARWVTEYFPLESVTERADGAVEVSLRIASRDWLLRLLLRLGSSAEVLDPAGLAEEVHALATDALANYAVPTT